MAVVSGCTPNYRLDHYKVYRIPNGGTIGTTVALSGQFDQVGKRKFVEHDYKLDELKFFANPVRKTSAAHPNGVPIMHPESHLTWYSLANPVQQSKTRVYVRNQFGSQTLDLDGPRYALMPALKQEVNGELPQTLDHFLCYRVTDYNFEAPKDDVGLRDQFGSSSATVVRPRYFCVPVNKKYNGQYQEIKNYRGHLTFYGILDKPNGMNSRPMTVRDQLLGEGRTITFGKARMLGVPTLKKHFEKMTHSPPEADDSD